MVEFLNKFINSDFENFSVQALVDFFAEVVAKLFGLAEDKMDIAE
jgi:hypothetical protein